MFKKPIKVSSNNSLSGKDVKKIVADLSKFLDPVSVSALLEQNKPVITINKLSGSKMVLYSIDNIPILVDATGKGDYFPSLYAIHLYPTLAKPVEINPGVDSFILNGANLMWPGVKNPTEMDKFAKDDVRYIKTSDNKIIGLGAMACSYDELKSKGPTGTAMLLLHIIDDKLWAFGPQKVLDPVPIISQDKNTEEVKIEEGSQIKSEKTDEKTKKKTETKEKAEEEDEGSEEEDHDADDLAQYFGGMIKKKPAGGQSQPSKPKVKASGPSKVEDKFEDDEEEDDEEKNKKKGKKPTKKREREGKRERKR